MTVNNLKLHEMQTAMNALAVEEAEKSGKKITSGIKTVSKAVGVDYATMKGFVFGTIKRPSERTVDRVRTFLRDGESKTPPSMDEPAAKNIGLMGLTDDDFAMLIGLLQAAESGIHDDYVALECDVLDDPSREFSVASYQALYRQEGLYKRLRRKIEAQTSCTFEWDTELQSVVPVRPKYLICSGANKFGMRLSLRSKRAPSACPHDGTSWARGVNTLSPCGFPSPCPKAGFFEEAMFDDEAVRGVVYGIAIAAAIWLLAWALGS